MNSEILRYIENYSLIYDSQNSFRKQRSSTDLLNTSQISGIALYIGRITTSLGVAWSSFDNSGLTTSFLSEVYKYCLMDTLLASTNQCLSYHDSVLAPTLLIHINDLLFATSTSIWSFSRSNNLPAINLHELDFCNKLHCKWKNI